MLLVQKQTYIKWDRTENHEINLYPCDQLTCNEKSKNIQWKKDSLFKRKCSEDWTTIY